MSRPLTVSICWPPPASATQTPHNSPHTLASQPAGPKPELLLQGPLLQQLQAYCNAIHCSRQPAGAAAVAAVSCCMSASVLPLLQLDMRWISSLSSSGRGPPPGGGGGAVDWSCGGHALPSTPWCGSTCCDTALQQVWVTA
jgi:hypothetical protein